MNSNFEKKLLNFYIEESSNSKLRLAENTPQQPSFANGSGAGWAGAVIGGVAGFFLGGFSGAIIGASLGASLANSLIKKKDDREPARLPTYSFDLSNSDNLARVSQPIPLVYCNSVVNNKGGVLYSGVIVSSCVENHGDIGFLYLTTILGHGFIGSIDSTRTLLNNLELYNFFSDTLSLSFLNGNPSKYRPDSSQGIFTEPKLKIFSSTSSPSSNNQIGINNIALAQDTSQLNYHEEEEEEGEGEEEESQSVKAYVKPINSSFTSVTETTIKFKPDSVWAGGLCSIRPLKVNGGSITVTIPDLPNRARLRIGYGKGQNLNDWAAYAEASRLDPLGDPSDEKLTIKQFNVFKNPPQRLVELVTHNYFHNHGIPGYNESINNLYGTYYPASSYALLERVLSPYNAPQTFNYPDNVPAPWVMLPSPTVLQLWLTPKELLGAEEIPEGGYLEITPTVGGYNGQNNYHKIFPKIPITLRQEDLGQLFIKITFDDNDFPSPDNILVRADQTFKDIRFYNSEGLLVTQKLELPLFDKFHSLVAYSYPTGAIPWNINGKFQFTVFEKEGNSREVGCEYVGGSTTELTGEPSLTSPILEDGGDYYLKVAVTRQNEITVDSVKHFDSAVATSGTRVSYSNLTFVADVGDVTVLKVYEDNPNTLENFALFSPSAKYYANGTKFTVIEKDANDRSIKVTPHLELDDESNIFRYWETVYSSYQELTNLIINFNGKFFSEPKPQIDDQLPGRTGLKGKA